MRSADIGSKSKRVPARARVPTKRLFQKDIQITRIREKGSNEFDLINW